MRAEDFPSDTSSVVDTVVFDLGNVLIAWDPRNLYRTMFDDVQRMEWFLAEVCPPSWNAQQDAGRTWDEAIAEAVSRHPAYEPEIRAYRERWSEMIPGAIEGTVQILKALHASDVPLHALTNWSAETFVEARERFDFLKLFRTIVVSGEERMIKPHPGIYQRLFETAGLDPMRCVFIDDSELNVKAARTLGMKAIHFRDPKDLAQRLSTLGFINTTVVRPFD